MATLTVWRFDDPDAAVRTEQVLERLVLEHPVVLLHDAAIVEWRAQEPRPRARQLTSAALTGQLGNGFWGLLFGLVFYVPLLSAAVGAAGGATAGSLAEIGIDDHFIHRVRDQVTPGTSALFVVSSNGATELADATYAGAAPAALIVTDLDDVQEAALRAVFGE